MIFTQRDDDIPSNPVLIRHPQFNYDVFLVPPASESCQLRTIQGRPMIRDGFLELGLGLILDKHLENREMRPTHGVTPHPRKLNK